MVLDLIVLALMGVFILAGYRNGAFAQILQSILLVASFLMAYMTRAPVGQLLGRLTGISSWYAGFAILLVLWLVAYVVLRIATAPLMKRWSDSKPEAGGFDRCFGAFLGGVRGLVGVYLALCTLTVANVVFAQISPPLWINYQKSRVGTFVEQNNVFEHVPDRRLRALGQLIRVASRDDLGAEELTSADALLILEEVDSGVLAKDPGLRTMAEQGEYRQLAAHPEIIRLLGDPGFQRLLDRVDAKEP
ncbi:MAG: hypothetical protein CMH54_01110 [Myxococcales bacterium]|nr:hypothetical protein [Myxococcales bacterium]|tara:strand:+ start:1209 stop:1949 length:741 start_codon:yes stop_codon:yes gene_type:complete